MAYDANVNGPDPICGDAIPLQTGIDRTAYWREYYKNYFPPFPPSPDGILRGFFIPLEDLQNLLTYHNQDPMMCGVRVYLSLENGGDYASADVLLVPVVKTNDDPPGPTNTQDLLIPLPCAQTAADSEELYSIYDFTRPCPDICDINSPLFGGG
jgi:hypothetical protein